MAAVRVLVAFVASGLLAFLPSGPAIASRAATTAACQGGASPPPVNVLRKCYGLTSPKEHVQVIESGDGIFKLQSPFVGTDIKKPTLCGSDGCIYKHWNWIGSGIEQVISGCNGNDPVCKVQLYTPGWTVVRVELDDNNENNEKIFVISRPEAGAAPRPKVSIAVSLSTPGINGKLALGGHGELIARVTPKGGSVKRLTVHAEASNKSAALIGPQSHVDLNTVNDGQADGFAFSFKGVSAGTVSLVVNATGTTASGTTVSGSDAVKIRVSGSALRVLVDVTPTKATLKTVPQFAEDKGGEPVKVTVRVKNTTATTVGHVFVNPKLLFAYDDGLPPGDSMPLRQNGQPAPAGDLGSLAPGASTKPVVFQLLANGDGGYSIEALATADQAGGGVLHATGTGKVTVVSPLLSFETKIDPNVNRGNSLDAAGVPYTIKVTMQDLSYRKSVVFFPRFRFKGNAQGGQLIPVDAEVPSQDSSDPAQACAVPQAIQLKPRQKEELKLVVYTSTAAASMLGASGGGTRSVVTVLNPLGWEVVDGSTGPQLTDDQIALSTPSEYEVHLQDPGILKYPESEYTPAMRALYISRGLLIGIGGFEYGILHGLFYDLPKGLINGYMGQLQFEADLYTTLKEHNLTVLDGTLINPVTKALLFAIQKAPALSKIVPQIPGQVKASIDKYFTGIANKWYAGDWRDGLQEMSAQSTEIVLGVASLAPSFAPDIASCILPRAQSAIKVLSETKTNLFNAAKASLDALPDTVPATVAFAKAAEIPSGMEVNYSIIQKFFGYTRQQVDYIRNFVRVNPTGKALLAVIRARAPQAIDWLDGAVAYGKKWAGAVLKPEQMKIKSVSWLDTEVEGYNAADTGRVVLRRPESVNEVRAALRAKGIPSTAIDPKTGRTVTNPVWADAFKLNAQRVNEYLHPRGGFTSGSGGYYKDIVDAARQGKMTLRWNLEDNSFGAGYTNGYNTYPFRLATTKGGPVPINELDTYLGDMIPEFFIGGKWRCVTGDADFLSLTAADSTPLDAADRFAASSALASGELGMLHPPADSWTQNGSFWFAAKQNEFERAGAVLQFAPDGSVRVVRYDPKLSVWKSITDYRPGYDGSYLAPPQSPGGG